MVALSVYVWNASTVSALVRELRYRKTGTTLVLGGPEVQYTPDLGLGRFDVDFICAGEGEAAFLGLVEDLSSKGSTVQYEPPPGIVSRSGNGGAVPLIAALDTIPSPFREGLISIPGSGWVDIETVRGCPFACSFCLYGKNLTNVREFSLKRVQRDLEWFVAHGATDIYFVDPTFNLPRERCEALLELLTAINRDRRLRIYVEARAEIMDDDLADRFVEAGITSVEVGLQAVQATALKLMQRGLGRKGFVNGCKHLHERNISVNIGVILGLPGDSVETIRETISYATQDLLGEVSAYRLRVLPGSDYWNRASRLGIEYAKEPPYFVSGTPLLSANALDAIEAEVAEGLQSHNRAYRESVSQQPGGGAVKLAKKELHLAKKEPPRTGRESTAEFVVSPST